MYAAQNGPLETVKILANETGANVNAASKGCWPALMCAAKNGHLKTVKFLANEKAADANFFTAVAPTGLGRLRSIFSATVATALLRAAKNGHVDTVRFLANKKRTDINARNQQGETALMLAIQSDHLDTVKFLVNETSADVNAISKNGSTALTIAANKNGIEVVELLAFIEVVELLAFVAILNNNKQAIQSLKAKNFDLQLTPLKFRHFLNNYHIKNFTDLKSCEAVLNSLAKQELYVTDENASRFIAELTQKQQACVASYAAIDTPSGGSS